MTDGERPSAGNAHLIRALLAIILVLSLPAVLYLSDAGGTVRVYQDALAAVVAFYFGASAEPGPSPR
jgi:hypothetical protein